MRGLSPFFIFCLSTFLGFPSLAVQERKGESKRGERFKPPRGLPPPGPPTLSSVASLRDDGQNFRRWLIPYESTTLGNFAHHPGAKRLNSERGVRGRHPPGGLNLYPHLLSPIIPFLSSMVCCRPFVKDFLRNIRTERRENKLAHDKRPEGSLKPTLQTTNPGL